MLSLLVQDLEVLLARLHVVSKVSRLSFLRRPRQSVRWVSNLFDRFDGKFELRLEMCSHIEQVGAGIQVPPNATRVMDSFGLLEKMALKATTLEQLDVRRYADGALLASKPLGEHCLRSLGYPWM